MSSDKRIALIEQFRASDRDDYPVRDAICLQLDKLFKRRVDWIRRHSTSYRYAQQRRIVPKATGPGIRNGVRVSKITARIQAEIAAGQDKIHAHCKLHGLDYLTQRRMGFDLRKRVEAGEVAGDVVSELISGVAK